MLEFIRKILAQPAGDAAGRSRVVMPAWPEVIYTIGDVHGCYMELERLLAMIVADASHVVGPKWIVLLGDYVDRGPRSASVLDLLCRAPPSGFERYCLVGNHETMFLDFIGNPRSDADWLRYGGIETLESYGIGRDSFARADLSSRKAILASHIPDEHIALLKSLPVMLALPGLIFTHAGVRPGVELMAQDERDLLWMREPFLSYEGSLGYRVVHGHTPAGQPEVLDHRIGIDTGAFATGVLTALRINQAGQVHFMSTGGDG